MKTKKYILSIIAVVIICLIFWRVKPTQTIEEHEAGLYEIIYAELQISAVTIDMHRYLGWFPNNKEMLKKASVKAINDLNSIKSYLQQYDFGQLSDLKNYHLTLTDKLIDLYSEIELKSDEDISNSFAEYNDIYSQYSKKMEEVIKGNKVFTNLSENIDPISEEIKFADDQQDKDIYLTAVDLIKNKNYEQAYKELVSLRDRYKDTVFESCIVFRMSECLISAEVKEDGLWDAEKGIEMLSNLLDREYSPVYFEAFCEWRSKRQFFWGGMSNTSEISNKKYNTKRLNVIHTIRQYLKTTPDDDWASSQVGMLLTLPNISRGGGFGNSNLSYRE